MTNKTAASAINRSAGSSIERLVRPSLHGSGKNWAASSMTPRRGPDTASGREPRPPSGRRSPLVRGAVANPMQMLLDHGQGLLKRGERPERHLTHDVRRTLVGLDDEPGPARSGQAPQGTAEQIRQGPGSPVIGRTRDG